MEEIEEVWKDIEGYEGLYQVSNLGRVKSLERIDNNNHLVKERILSPKTTRYGYLEVDLCKEGKQKMFKVHRLVAHAFIPNPEGLPEINHKDENKTNNLVDNIEYCDRFYNMRYGTRNERMIQTRISKGIVDPELCGLTEKERKRMYRQKNLEKIREYQREWASKHRRRKKKQPSEESLW